MNASDYHCQVGDVASAWTSTEQRRSVVTAGEPQAGKASGAATQRKQSSRRSAGNKEPLAEISVVAHDGSKISLLELEQQRMAKP